MKKEQKNQQFEKIVEPSELLGLEMADLKGGGVDVTCNTGKTTGTKTTCDKGTVDQKRELCF